MRHALMHRTICFISFLTKLKRVVLQGVLTLTYAGVWKLSVCTAYQDRDLLRRTRKRCEVIVVPRPFDVLRFFPLYHWVDTSWKASSHISRCHQDCSLRLSSLVGHRSRTCCSEWMSEKRTRSSRPGTLCAQAEMVLIVSLRWFPEAVQD